MNFFASDLHLYNDIKAKELMRTHLTAEEFAEEFITDINNRASENDTLYIAGDLFNYCSYDKGSYIKTFEFPKRVNCKVVLIMGNNEYRLVSALYDGSFKKFREDCISRGFHEVYRDAYINMWGKTFYIAHKPIDSRSGMLNIFGHVHNVCRLTPFGINACVDCNYGKALDEYQLKQIIKDIVHFTHDEESFLYCLNLNKFPTYLWKSYLTAINVAEK